VKRNCCWIVFLLVACASSDKLHAQTETYLVARMGMRNASTYHYLELLQARGRWFAPDFLYIDYGKSDYRELWVGAGRSLLQSKKISLANGCYFDAAVGSAANGALYLLPWTWVTYQLTSRIGGETYYLPYVPLNNSGTLQHVLERAKLEYSWSHFKLGSGYAGYKAGSGSWQNRPFVTGTLRGNKLGELELWLQRLPENKLQLQLRYVISHKSH
jgi:hypothetical protein